MLKEKIELLIERLSDRDNAQREFAIKEIANETQGATSSMTSVPRPLKFLSTHYKSLEATYETLVHSEFKVSIDIG